MKSEKRENKSYDFFSLFSLFMGVPHGVYPMGPWGGLKMAVVVFMMLMAMTMLTEVVMGRGELIRHGAIVRCVTHEVYV